MLEHLTGYQHTSPDALYGEFFSANQVLKSPETDR